VLFIFVVNEKTPFVVLEATHEKALEYTTLELLQKYEAVV